MRSKKDKATFLNKQSGFICTVMGGAILTVMRGSFITVLSG